MLVKKLKEWLGTASEEQTFQPGRDSLQLASALLMLEIGKADFELSSQELEFIRAALKRQFSLTDGEIEEFVDYALDEHEQHVSAHDLIKTLNNGLSIEEKIGLVENLWRIALLDHELNKYEEYHIRKIADWLYLSHSDFIRAKHRAGKRSGTLS